MTQLDVKLELFIKVSPDRFDGLLHHLCTLPGVYKYEILRKVKLKSSQSKKNVLEKVERIKAMEEKKNE